MSPQFGDRVLVLARTVRVNASVDRHGAVSFRQSIPPRDHGRIAAEDLTDAKEWPGDPVPGEWAPPPGGFEFDPTGPGPAVFVRLRRLHMAVPTAGVVVGWTHKEEGTLRGGGPQGNNLAGPGRRIALYEVAVPPRSKAQLVLAHSADLVELPAPHTVSPAT